MIISRLKGGLGNQLFQIACGWSLAKRRECPLAFDIEWYGKADRRELVLKRLNVEARPLSWRDRQVLPYAGGPSARLARLPWLRWAFPSPPVHFIQRAETRAEDLMNLDTRHPVYLEGYWQSPVFFAEYADSIRAMLTAGSAARVARPYPGAYVALHIRRGDYLDARHRMSFGALDDDYYRRAIALLSREMGPVVAVVFSDEPQLVQPYLQLDVPAIYPDQQRMSPLAALHLMASCDHFVIANSTFSWWGAWLGEHPQKQVIAPQPWLRDRPTSIVLHMPDGWRRQPASWMAADACEALIAARSG